MNLNKKQFNLDFGGQPVSLTISQMAEQANAAVLGQHGETAVLVTVTLGKEDRNIDYFPLVVDYEEKFYAAGKIIGSRFIRREGRPSEEAVLSGRLIDRSLRPLFPQNLRRDVQIIITVLSYDEENDPEFIALLSASAALAISEVPWNGPVAGVRIAVKKDGEIAVSPKNSLIKEFGEFALETFVSGTEEKINMLELAGNESSEAETVRAFGAAQTEIAKLIQFVKSIVKEYGKEKIKVPDSEENLELKKKIVNFLKDKIENAIYQKDKTERFREIAEMKEALKNHLTEEGLSGADLAPVNRLLEEEVGRIVRKNILESEKRPDGRRLDEVRELHAEVGLFKRLHGSALFARGNTQALAAVTLAAPGAEQLIETMEISTKRRFMLHYNFPPYSVGEIGRLGAPGRREIGHGALAEKGLRPLIPSQDEFPYTIRLVSEILSSNGSSSMATVSAGSLALMDAGVPIRKAAAGIAMGLITDKTNNQQLTTNNYKILTDLQGPEDHHGDMDFKVAGTKDGITAIQLDVKIEGLTIEIIGATLTQAKKARLEILDAMNATIAQPRAEVSSYAPVIMTTNVRPDQIGEVIGPAGKIINGIIAATGVLSIDIEQTGKVFVAAHDIDKARAAIAQVQAITRTFEIGEIIEGEIIKILDFGAIVDLGGGKDGMIHVSELKEGFVQKVEDVVKLGDKVKAKIIRAENGKIGLSIKALPHD
ncbi:polyribonucleotide nucleotidyltransferase [Candidatus Wolfebacteria bacterium]|nr:polyribonucleotide nucleotidyltransferase [Candidatus Wolfebacteria bacterium]